jgi:YHS domain-containing protein
MGAVAAGVFGPQVVQAGPFTWKKPTAAPKQPANTVPPELLSVPPSDAVVIQPVAQSGGPKPTAPGQKSEVMKQLELLYQQDGREMPELNTDIRPVPTNGSPAAPGAAPATAAPAQAPALRTQQPTSTQPKPQAPAAQYQPVPSQYQNPQYQQPQAQQPSEPIHQPIGQQEGKKNPVTAFFKKLVPGGNKDPKPTKAPSDFRPDVAPLPPAYVGAPPAQLRPEHQVLVGNAPATTIDATLPVLDSQPRTPFMVTVGTTPAALPKPLSELGLPPSPETTASAQVDGLPPFSNTVAELPQLNSAPTATIELPPAAPADASPFSEMSEADADKKLEMNPFTGLTLNEDAGSANAGKAQLTPPAAETSKEDPFADELKAMGVVPPDAAPTTTPTLATPPSQLPQKIASSEIPSFDGIEDQATRDKMKKIHERGSMKGLKGFCPVTLRDQRELIDAKPEFHSTFRGQKFHFAGSEAKLKFDEEPARYAPAAYGADVVALTRDKDVVEGTLDFAAWFKGRLYLFGNQETHDTFVANPSQFAAPVGIE